jgi:hypothetical protein
MEKKSKTLATLTATRIKRWQQRFLRSLRACPNVTVACSAAHVSRQTAYRSRTDDAAFAEKWESALSVSVDKIEMKAFETALAGDPNLLQFMLRCHRPTIYRETQRHEVGLLGGIIFLPTKKEGAE